MRSILSVSIEPALLHTRGLVLERTGAFVKSATPDIALLLLKNETFDLVILCHSLPQQEAQAVYDLSKTCEPPCKILLIEASNIAKPPEVPADLRYALEDGPHALVRGAVGLLRGMEALNDGPRRPASVPDASSTQSKWPGSVGMASDRRKASTSPDTAATSQARCSGNCHALRAGAEAVLEPGDSSLLGHAGRDQDPRGE